MVLLPDFISKDFKVLSNWTITFEWHSRPIHHKGKPHLSYVAFAAYDLTEAYRCARDYAASHYSRHRWRIINVIEHLGSSHIQHL